MAITKIDCCNDCVAPKRHIGCHSTCKEYIEKSTARKKDLKALKKKRDEDAKLTALLLKNMRR